jgi:hypothetical protein
MRAIALYAYLALACFTKRHDIWALFVYQSNLSIFLASAHSVIPCVNIL